MNRNNKHPKTIRELVKEIRSRKQAGTSIIAEAIEALDIHQSADFTLLNGIIEASERRVLKIMRRRLLVILAALVGLAVGHVI